MNEVEDNTSALFDEAAELVLRLHARDSGPKELEALERWARCSEEHAEAAAKAQDLWREIGLIRDIPWPSDAELAVEVARSDTRTGTARLRRRAWRRAGIAVALAASAALAAVIMIRSPAPTLLDTYVTGVSEHRLASLPDGSEIMIGAKSTLRIQYSLTERIVYLDAGEALFTVSKDAERPFLVRTGNVLVRAVGTAFNVRAAEDQSVVSVIEGVVRVRKTHVLDGKIEELGGISAAALSPSALNTELRVGDQLVIGLDEVAVVNHPRDINASIAWRDGRLIFTGQPLGAVIADVNRYASVPIEVSDAGINELQFSGTVLRNQVDDWLGGLEVAYPILVDRSHNDRVILRDSAQSGQR